MASWDRKIRRARLRGVLLAQARAHGCTCDPDITLPPIEPGKVRVVTIAHDNDCPHYVDNSASAKRLVARINAGEFDWCPNDGEGQS
jgi:hypothetical protein